MSRVSHLLFFLISHVLLLSLVQGEETKPKPECEPLSCGLLGHIRFPFSNETYPDCGLLMVEGCNEQVQTIQLDKDWPRLYITGISQDNTLELRDELGSSESSNSHSCNDSLKNLTLSSPFISFELSVNQTLFKCPRYTIPEDFVSSCNDSQHSIIYYNGTSHNISNISSKLSPGCSNIQFRKNKNHKGIDFKNLFTGSFRLQVNVTNECHECHMRRGQCQIDDNGKFQCLNATKGDGQLGSKLGRGLAIGTSATVVVILTIILFVMKKSSSDNCMVFWKKKTESCQNIEAFLRNYGSLALKRYNYSDIKKMTNSFREKLGQGGYGGVYRGRLQDGRTVAVKVKKEAQGNGEEFINEVATISRTSHVNIVALLGFCFEGHKRALIYEFVPNGSLEKFIYRKNLSEPNQKLKWETVYQIAVGIAQGLEYLHRGCSTRILHFDIKPHNILLDEDFCPKISDFGLAKICLKKESIVSMTGARGTIGYIAPELCCRNFGRVSHKSDVYSYGMMVLEMVGGRKNIDVGVDHSSEIYFPHWIYNRLEVDEGLVPQGTSNEEEKECARKMVIVSLWCIQTNPSNRPTMSRVVDMLKGSIGSLQIPPKPFLSSPRSPPRDYSSTTLVS